jgi:glycosyltransferase involved in cell wall biosynthesis
MATILHLIPTLEGGGAERQLTILAAEQARRGLGVHVALRRGGVHEERMRGSGVVIHSLGDFRGVHPLLIARADALVRRIKPDILQTWLPQMDLLGGVVALWNAVPWLLSERNVKESYHRILPLAWVRSRLARYAKGVVANSAEGAEYWIGTLPAPMHVTRIDNAVDVAAICGAPISCQPSGNTGHILLFVGRLLEEKGPHLLIQALRHLAERSDVRALFVGDGPLRQEICASITAHDLENRVSMLPYQPDWWGLLKTATALVSPSRFEGQPNVVLEAMAAGCPLIVSDIPSHRAILDTRSALFVPLNNPTALADAIVSLLSDPEAARQRAERASERVTGFTIKSAADAYDRLYGRVLNGWTC